MFEKDSCYKLGYIAKPHGFKGELSIFLDTANPSDYTELESVFVEYDQKLIPFFLEKIDIQNKGFAVVRFEDIDTEKKAKFLVGCSLYMPLETLPQTEQDKAGLHDLVGFTVIDSEFGELGKITDVINESINPLLQIDHNGLEVLIPKQKDFIEKVDRKKKILYLSTPAGLLNIYLNAGEEE